MDKLFKTVSESQIEISELMLPSHANFGGKVHGGYILALMDQVAFACASKHAGNYCVTASVNRVDFLHPIEIGEMVKLQASINYVGRTSMVVGIKVTAENIVSGEIKHCNSSYLTMVAKASDGKTNVEVPGLVIEHEDQLRRFAKSIQRQQHQKTRESEFKEDGFDRSLYLDKIKGRRVKVRL